MSINNTNCIIWGGLNFTTGTMEFILWGWHKLTINIHGFSRWRNDSLDAIWGRFLLERYFKRRWRLFCLEGEICLDFFLEPTVSVLRKAFWLDFQTKCTKSPWLSSFTVQESFFPDEAASQMQATTMSGRKLLKIIRSHLCGFGSLLFMLSTRDFAYTLVSNPPTRFAEVKMVSPKLYMPHTRFEEVKTDSPTLYKPPTRLT